MSIPACAEILLVESNPFEASVTKAAILKSKITERIHWAKDGEEALNFIFSPCQKLDNEASLLPRIIILSLNIPKVSGMEVLQKIKDNPATSRIVTILISPTEENEAFLHAIKSGVNMCLVKDKDFEKFCVAIKKELGYYWRLFS